VSADAGYHRRLLILLSVASFFEGYDFLALSQLLPTLRDHFGLSKGAGGALVTVVNLGTMIAYVLVRAADRWGRKRALSITIAGYTIASLVSGLAPNVYFFAIAQLVARIFLIGEWAIALVIAAEEFPAEKRGSAMGIIQAASSLGAIVCAGVVPLLLKLPTGWRSIYFVGAIPLVLVALARRQMRETKRFATRTEESGRRITDVFRGPYKRRILEVALVWALSYVGTQTAVTFWKDFALTERSMAEEQAGLAITIAAVGALPLVFLSGKMLDVLGRRKSAAIIFLATSGGTAGAYLLGGTWSLTAALVLAIFGTTAVLQVLNTYNAELFPTDMRADAFAWANNLLGRLGYVIAPIVVGFAADHSSWSLAVSTTAVFPLLALGIILARFPETRGKELEETAKV
jgi:MFS transporter, putative metabolite:H+ symporter